MTKDEIQLLYEYDAWANRRVLDAASALTPEQFTRDLGSSFPSVRDTLAHIMGGQWIWLERWQGRTPTGLPAAEDFPDLPSLRKRWEEVEADLLAFVRGLTAERLVSVSEYKTLTAGTFACPLWQMLQHLVNHGTYHRGQATTLLRQLGAKSVSTDLSLFYRERGAAATA
ncbi:MAG: DinB family protein [Acidobacteria bacterium]|nr:DinB family protein [Acidobacteriota bacterium]